MITSRIFFLLVKVVLWSQYVDPDQFALCSYVVLLFELHVESGGVGVGGWVWGWGLGWDYSGPVRTKIKFFQWLLIYNHIHGIASISVTWFQRNMRRATRYNTPPFFMSICRTSGLRRILNLFILCSLSYYYLL